MYLEHFGLHELPFTLTPNLHFFCNLITYQEALSIVSFNLKNGEGFIKITGEVGTGKTILCRKLLADIDENHTTVYINNPKLDHTSLQKVIAQELGLSEPKDLNLKLLELAKHNKPVVIIIDEAQAIPDDTLESLRLLTNLETETEKLLQIVLFGQPELDTRLKQYALRQLAQRITFSYRLNRLTTLDLANYLHHRLALSGYPKAYNFLFTKPALKLLALASKGIPRLVNILCHKALLLAYSANKPRVTCYSMLLAILTTESASFTKSWGYYISNYLLILLGIIVIIILFLIMRPIYL